VGAQAVYIEIYVVELEGAIFGPSLFKRVHEIEKIESDNVTGPWRGLGLADR
jgi:hypothetical protein